MVLSKRILRGIFAVALAGLCLVSVADAQLLSSSSAHNQVTCDTTAGGVLVVAANPGRRHLILRNQSTTVDIAVGSGVPVALTVNNGIRIPFNTVTTGSVGLYLPLPGYAGALRCITASSAVLEYIELDN